MKNANAHPTPQYRSLIILGDSISIDSYPGLDYENRNGVFPHDTRLGAGSLLFRNDDELFPEFRGRDLASLCNVPEEEFFNLAVDGAVPKDVLQVQIPKIPPSADESLVVVTAGGNVLLMMLPETAVTTPDPNDPRVGQAAEDVRKIVRKVRRLRPHSRVVLCTIYDPSDGTATLPAHIGISGTLEVQARWLANLNDAIRRIAGEEENVVLADIQAHFLGHGWASSDPWYYGPMPFEPGFRGASEVRRVVLDAAGLSSVPAQAREAV
jgi:acyl-CoA thioesterase I